MYMKYKSCKTTNRKQWRMLLEEPCKFNSWKKEEKEFKKKMKEEEEKEERENPQKMFKYLWVPFAKDTYQCQGQMEVENSCLDLEGSCC